jgi:large repetitive protein
MRRVRGVRGRGTARRLRPVAVIALTTAALITVWLVAAGSSAQAQGVSGYTEVTGASVTVPGFTSATGSATCPTGDVVLSGGYMLLGGNMVVAASAPVDAKGSISTNTWTVTGFDNGDGQGSFTPYAICVSSSIAGYSEASKAQSVAAASSAQLTQTCPTGSVITGGGFAAGSTAPVINESDPTSSSNVSRTTWTVFVDNTGARTVQSVTTFVVCVSNTISGYSEQLAQSSTAGIVSATCPSGSLVIGGGVSAPGPPNTSLDAPVVQNPAGGFVVSNTSWSVDAASTGGGVIGSIAICAAPLPTVNSLKPSTGPAGGGNSIAVVGSNLTGATAVTFGSTPATSFSVVSSGQINAVAPAGSGAVDVTVTTPGGTSPTVSGDIYKYVPSVTSVSPTSGPTTGGTTVTINGTGFTGATAVSFGGTAATFSVKSSSQITATAPAGSGTVDITVTTPGGTSATNAGDQYTYVAPPTVTRVSPSSGPATGGTSVAITGTNFTGATAVSFGGTAATSFSVNSATSITATSPAGSGAVDVTVTIPGGGTSAKNASDVFKYVPAVTSVSPTSGPTTGGTSVTINGAGFTGATAVNFGATAATTFTVNSSSKITATAPKEAAGTVDITVTTPGGTTATSASDMYTYTTGPSVAAISPTSGPTAGGTSVTITGANLDNPTAVKFGATAATVVSHSATQIVATSPAHAAATVDITVTTAGGTSATSAADKYTYAAPPTVSGISPASGPALGGTVVTITGTNLANPTAVKFGGSNAAVITPVSATQITAVSPSGSAGAKDVQVTTPGGTSTTSSADQFTFVAAPTVTGLSPSSGPASGQTSVTITGTDFTGATAVTFGATPASFSVAGPTKITATSPAGSGVADVRVATPNGTSSITPADRFTYNPTKITPPPGSPMVATGAPTVKSSSGAALEGSVNPQGLPTTAHYEYGLDSKFRASGPVYDQSTPSQNVGSDFTSHTVTATLSGLVPNALYHVRLVANNSAGTTVGPDATFTTKADPPPSAPKLGGSFNAEPVSGLVFIKINGKFIPITEVRQIPNGAIINALHGTVVLATAAGPSGPAKVSQAARAKRKKPKVTTQTGTFGGAVFKVTQVHSGLVTLSLVEGAGFPGAPTYASCKTHSGKATVAALSKRTLQLLHGSDKHGKFRTKGRYAAATVRGTVWSTADRCDGTLTHVSRGTVVVSDFVRHKTITVHAGHSYLALARPPRHK